MTIWSIKARRSRFIELKILCEFLGSTSLGIIGNILKITPRSLAAYYFRHEQADPRLCKSVIKRVPFAAYQGFDTCHSQALRPSLPWAAKLRLCEID